MSDTRRAVKSFWERAERFHEQNIRAARIILQDLGKHGGETAGLVRWARLTLSRDRAVRREAA